MTTSKQDFISRLKALNKMQQAKMFENCPMKASWTGVLLPLWTHSSLNNMALPTNNLPITINNLMFPEQLWQKMMTTMIANQSKVEQSKDMMGKSCQTTQQLMDNGIGQHFYSIPIHAQGATTKNNLAIKPILNPQMLRTWHLIGYFNQFFPWGYIQLCVIPATNMEMKEINKGKTTMHRIKTCLGIWFLMSLNAQYSGDEFFKIKTKGYCHNFSTLLGVASTCPKEVSKRFCNISDQQTILILHTRIIVGWSGTGQVY